jgi:hypothetical protein
VDGRLDRKKRALLEQHLREWDRAPELLLGLVGNKRLQMRIEARLRTDHVAPKLRPCFAPVAVFPFEGMPYTWMDWGFDRQVPVAFYPAPYFVAVPAMPRSDLYSRVYSQI